jgi:sodium/proline symporter
VWDYIPIGGMTLSGRTGLYSLVVGFAVSLILIVAVSLATKAPDEEILKEFDDVKNGVNCGADEG